MARNKPRKVRVSLRKNRLKRKRVGDVTKKSLADDPQDVDPVAGERITGKGDLTRQRTILATDDEAGAGLVRSVDDSKCRSARVISATGLHCVVSDGAGRRYECTVRRMVRTMARDERAAVVAGDFVLFQPVDAAHGVIERVNPRKTTLARAIKRKEHVIAANIDQALIVVSAANPALKTNLVDRLIASAHKGGVRPVVCINKIDLVDRVRMQPIVGMYARLGYNVVLTSATTGLGIDDLRRLLKDRASVATGQSGVGKSSLLNTLQPELELETGDVSDWTHKGRHTTRSAVLWELGFGGWVVDTPGIRQMQLWDVPSAEVEDFFLEFRPFVPRCRFPDCSHTHETQCAVQSAVDRDLVSPVRYASYLKIMSGDAG